jgi:hypothetical protein
MDHVQDPSLVPSGPYAEKAEDISSNIENGESIAPQSQAALKDPTVIVPANSVNRSWSMGSYPKLSSFMTSWPDVAIFRRFGALNAQNLLFLQAEITHLERELQVIRESNALNNDEKGIHGERNWFELSQESEDGEPHPQWVVIQDIRDRLKEYSKSFQSDSGPVCLYWG